MNEPTKVRICVESDDDANRVAAVLVALGYEVERDMTLAGGASRVAWAAIEIARAYSLTNGERCMLGKLFAGDSLEDIAQQLELSKGTVQFHLTNIYFKTNTTNLVELLLLGIRKLAGE
jgi:DNA-binding CsgD family transcriptional regulator